MRVNGEEVEAALWGSGLHKGTGIEVTRGSVGLREETSFPRGIKAEVFQC